MITKTKNNSSNSGTTSARIAKTDSLSYYFNLMSPTRDFNNSINNLPEVLPLKFDAIQQDLVAKAGGGGNNGDCYSLPICNGISFPLQSGWSCDVLPPKDNYNNVINAFGKYGTDVRQQYYVQYPPSKNVNSPIIVLIHGGGWCVGPNPDNVQGWSTGFTLPSLPADNFVKKLLDNDFVVVTLLYRLSRYGNNNAEITANPVNLQNQLNDIDAGILHIRNNFSTCLNINANSIQVLGESAGGHLAMMWAYTKTTISSTYVKSIVDMYAPTNLQQYGNYMMNIPTIFACTSPPATPSTYTGAHFPWYFPIANLANPLEVYNRTVFDCKAQGYPNSRILQTYKMIQSLVATAPITTPLTSTDLANASPCNTISTASIKIPTFVMHGKNDLLVPYSQATNTMDAKLTSNGGLVFNYANSSGIVPTTYTSNPKHGIKLYDNANHTWATTDNNIFTNLFSQNTLYTLVRNDAIKWLNGHK